MTAIPAGPSRSRESPRMAAKKTPGGFLPGVFDQTRNAAYFEAASSSFSSCGAGATSCMIQRM